MKCVKPFVTATAAYGCGQCMPCRFNKQRLWYHRILLEALDHSGSAFVTLTYSDSKLPSDGSLVPRDLTLWLKRFRKSQEPARLRYFSVGEYGDKTYRPHYHVVLFGVSCLMGPFTLSVDGWRCECPVCCAVRRTWDYGWSSISPLTLGRAKYVAKYTLKKMTARSDLRLSGRYPEFSRMSLRPGIGANAMWDIADVVLKYRLLLPGALAHGKKALPLGRYLRRKLSEYSGVEVTQQEDKALQAVRAFAFAHSRSVSSVYKELFSELEVALENKARIAHEKAQI